MTAGDLDVAIVNSTRRKPGLASHRLLMKSWFVFERRASTHNCTPIPFARLKDRALVLPSRRHGIRSIVNSTAEGLGIVITPQIEVDALESTLKLVAESELTTVLPAIVDASPPPVPLQTRRIVEPTLKRELVYVYRAQRPLSPVLSMLS